MHQIQCGSKAVGHPVLRILENLGYMAMKMSKALRDRDPKLQQQASDVVRNRRSIPDQQLT